MILTGRKKEEEKKKNNGRRSVWKETSQRETTQNLPVREVMSSKGHFLFIALLCADTAASPAPS